MALAMIIALTLEGARGRNGSPCTWLGAIRGPRAGTDTPREAGPRGFVS